LKCDELQDLILPFAADALEDAERKEVAAHLATGCPRCAGALAEAQALISRIPLGLDPVTPRLDTKQRLMKRISAQTTNRSWAWRLIPMGIAALIAVVVTLIANRPPVTVIAMQSTDSKAKADIFWDKSQNQWSLVATGLSPLPGNKTYELWFITDKAKIRAGTFNPDSNGSASLEVKIPRDIGPIQLAAVTDEPAGGVDQPTGSIQLKGVVK